MVQRNFDIKVNKDAKRFEFTPKSNAFNSYTVNFNEAKTLEDACIAVFKALNGKPCRFCGLPVDENYACGEISNCLTVPG